MIYDLFNVENILKIYTLSSPDTGEPFSLAHSQFFAELASSGHYFAEHDNHFTISDKRTVSKAILRSRREKGMFILYDSRYI